MNGRIKRWLRPVAYPPLHAWQWLHDQSRGRLRDYRDRRRLLRGETILLEDIHGIRFLLYPFDRPNVLHLVRRDYDSAEFQAVPRLVRAGDMAIDIGANAGLYSVLLSRLCGPSGHVWSFEPVPDTCWRLRETVALNRCENVTVVQAAVTEKSGNVRMNLFESRYAEWNTLGAPPARRVNGKTVFASESIDVGAFALDDFCESQKVGRINFLKVDVEGFELSVFSGAENLLRSGKIDYICFEIAKQPLGVAGVESRRVFQTLEAHGYASFRFNATKGRFEGPVTNTSEEWMNFFASRRDLAANGETEAPTARNLP